MNRPARVASRHWEVAALLVLAAIVYRPWTATALPILDFSEFFPHLRTHSSMLAQFVAVIHAMSSQGRYCPLLYAYIVAAWNLFGMWAPGWNWTYFIVNSSVIIFGRRLFLRIGIARAAAIAALTLWAFSPAVTQSWLRPTGEPYGLLLTITALGLAYNYAGAPDWRRRAILIAGLAFLTIAAKEMLVVLLPVVWLMTRLRHEDGRWSWAAWSKRDAVVTAYTVVLCIAALAPVAYVALTAPPGNYAGRYGAANISESVFVGKLITVSLPSAVGLPNLSRLVNDPEWQAWLVLPNLAWLVVILFGITGFAARRQASAGESNGLRWPLLMGFIWAGAGVLAYLPWPTQAGFYMLPFAFGTAFAICFIVGEIRGRAVMLIATCAFFFVLVDTSIEARDTVHLNEARIKSDVEILAAIQRLGPRLPLFAAVTDPAPEGGYGWALKLAQYGRAAGTIAPDSAGDMSCEQGRQQAGSLNPSIIVSGVDGCGAIKDRSLEVSEITARRRWPYLFTPHRVARTAYVARSGEQLVSISSQ